MSTFNSYTVYDKAGNLLADAKSSGGRLSSGGAAATTPETYFNSLPSEIQRRANVMLVLQESGFVARYRVAQPTVPAPTLGLREDLKRRA